ncbi:MAG TPA: glycosyltransferase family 9 protein, partial [Candidatus Kapabacteria bacterium]|nr:glycosyltransferase family 9 protein [Candidatus Kapabacteria bacterium]
CVTNRTTKYGMLAKRIARDSYTVALAHNERPEYGKLYSRMIDVPNMYERPYAEIMLEFVRQTFDVPITAGDELPRIGIEERYTGEAMDFLRSSGVPQHTALLLNLSAGQPRKRWSEEKYIALIDMLCDKFDAVILTASPEDSEKATRIFKQYNNKVYLFHSANIRSLAALAAQCLMVVTPDTSVVHIAAAARVPVVTWNSSIENAVSQWIPNGIPYRAVYTDQYNAEAVPPEEVFKNVNELYSAIAL